MDSVLAQLFLHFGVPFIVGIIAYFSVPLAHNPFVPQIVAASLGAIVNYALGRKWHLAFVNLLWLAGAFGWSGYLNEIDFKQPFSGWQGAVEAILVVSAFVGVWFCVVWAWRGIKETLKLLARIPLFWRKPRQKIVKRYIVFLLLTVIFTLAGLGGLSLWLICVGAGRVGYWVYLSAEEAVGICLQGFRFADHLKHASLRSVVTSSAETIARHLKLARLPH